MEYWERLALECEELLLRYQLAKTEGERIVLMAMARAKQKEAQVLCHLSKNKQE